MNSVRRYEIPKSSAIVMLVGGTLLLLAGLVEISVPIWEEEAGSLIEILFFLVAGTLMSALGAWSVVLLFRRKAYSLEISDIGIRNFHPTHVPWLYWDEIEELSVHRFLQRVDVVGRNRSQIVRIEYQISNCDEALTAVATQARKIREVYQGKTDFAMTHAFANRIFIAFFVTAAFSFGLWLFIYYDNFWGIVSALIILFAFFMEAKQTVRHVTIKDTEVRLQTGRELSTITRDQIESVCLIARPVGKGIRRLSVCVKLSDGTVKHITPPGVDPLPLFFALKRVQEMGKIL